MVKRKNNFKARKLKRRFKGKAKKQKNSEIKMQKAKDNNKRSLKSSNQSQKKRTRRKKKMKKLRMSGESRGAPIVGDVCQFVDFFGARVMGTGCDDGSKLVITQK